MNVELEVFKVGPHTLVVLSNGQLLYGPKIICEFQHFQIDYESMGGGIMTTYSKTQILLFILECLFASTNNRHDIFTCG